MDVILFLALMALNLYFISIAGGWIAFGVAALLVVIFAVFSKNRIISYLLPFFIVGFVFGGLVAMNLVVEELTLAMIMTVGTLLGWVLWVLLQPRSQI